MGPVAGAFDVGTRREGTPVTLPHDFMRTLKRTPGSKAEIGFYPSATVAYTKRFSVPEDFADRRVSFEFDGVYRDAMVYINSNFAAQRPNGYSRFIVEADAHLKYGQVNEIKVVARMHDDARWYSGIGIHREVHMLVGSLVHIAPDGIRITTPDIDGERAIVTPAIQVINRSLSTRTVSVHTRILDSAGVEVASDEAPISLRSGATETLRQRLTVADPQRWDVNTPHLYTAEVTLSELGTQGSWVDADAVTFGIRTLQLDVDHGLRINGETVKLRGTCIHHDNGVIGSVAIRRAEERRIELLKAAGFNAIRSAHNPLSRGLLDACDRLGMLVMDEAFDVWTDPKMPLDYALSFSDWWERDIDSMIAKDFNHPSVVIYSIGNEITEVGTPLGSGIGRRIAERVRDLDPTRYVTNSVNLFLAALPKMGELRAEHQAGAGNINDVMTEMSNMGDMLNRVGSSKVVTETTAETFAVVDIAGINYGDSRYELDRELFPNRVILGTETFPNHIAENWRLVLANSHVIGDFTWTGWDYIGEAGVGRLRYEGEDSPMSVGAYPWRLAWCGDIDITGHRRPASFYREIVYGLRREPYLAVLRPERHGDRVLGGLWAWSDSISSWSWNVAPGSPVTVEVYTADPDVELLIDGSSVGTSPAGPDNGFRATFEVTWQPGAITAIGIAANGERTASTLRTASDRVGLAVRVDRSTIANNTGELAFIELTVEDEAGIVATQLERQVTVELSGPGVLQGFGSANPKTEEGYVESTTAMFDGRAQAVIRPTAPGDITVTFRSDHGEETSSVIHVVAE